MQTAHASTLHYQDVPQEIPAGVEIVTDSSMIRHSDRSATVVVQAPSREIFETSMNLITAAVARHLEANGLKGAGLSNPGAPYPYYKDVPDGTLPPQTGRKPDGYRVDLKYLGTGR